MIEQRAQLFVALLKRFGVGQRFKIKEIIELGLESGTLASEIAQLIPSGKWNSRGAGHLLRRHKDIPHLGVTLRAQQTPLRVQEYWFAGEPDPLLKSEINREPPL